MLQRVEEGMNIHGNMEEGMNIHGNMEEGMNIHGNMEEGMNIHGKHGNMEEGMNIHGKLFEIAWPRVENKNGNQSEAVNKIQSHYDIW